ncbi:hypothetical protein V1478_010817 [Vespula squamosa]|uniref:Uncharacterized protein n=1 Tax=Vespula squamosa TaxID=30214 RepID=A0ABD2AFP4_VESSQ
MERGQDRSIEFSVITSVGLEKGFHANSCQIGNDEDGGSERRGIGRSRMVELGLRDSETTWKGGGEKEKKKKKKKKDKEEEEEEEEKEEEGWSG